MYFSFPLSADSAKSPSAFFYSLLNCLWNIPSSPTGSLLSSGPSTLLNCIQVLQFTSLLLAAFYFLLKRIQGLWFTSLLLIFTALQSSSLHFLTALLHLDIELAAVVSCSKLGDSGLVLEMKIYCRIRNSYYSCMVIVTYLNCWFFVLIQIFVQTSVSSLTKTLKRPLKLHKIFTILELKCSK